MKKILLAVLTMFLTCALYGQTVAPGAPPRTPVTWTAIWPTAVSSHTPGLWVTLQQMTLPAEITVTRIQVVIQGDLSADPAGCSVQPRFRVYDGTTSSTVASMANGAASADSGVFSQAYSASLDGTH